jgi:hypothetical protein
MNYKYYKFGDEVLAYDLIDEKQNRDQSVQITATMISFNTKMFVKFNDFMLTKFKGVDQVNIPSYLYGQKEEIDEDTYYELLTNYAGF